MTFSVGDISVVSMTGSVLMTVTEDEFEAVASFGSATVTVQVSSSSGETVSGDNVISASVPSSVPS